jgi:hypothetical protein
MGLQCKTCKYETNRHGIYEELMAIHATGPEAHGPSLKIQPGTWSACSWLNGLVLRGLRGRLSGLALGASEVGLAARP